MVKLPIRIPMYFEDIIVSMANSTMGRQKRNALSVKKKDEVVLASIAFQLNKGLGLTAKQQQLCIKLMKEYKSQLKNKLNLEIDDYSKIPRRLGTRKPVERRPTEYEMDFNEKENVIEFRFPYDEALQKFLRGQMYTTRGRVMYDKVGKYWTIYASAHNIKTYVMHFVDKFKISKRLEERFDFIMQEDEKHKNVMVLQSDLSIPYAPEELVEYLKKKTEGMTEKERFLYMVDKAGIYGYSISEKVRGKVYAEYGTPMGDLIVIHHTQLNPAEYKLTPEIVMEYSKLVNRDILLVGSSTTGRWERTWDEMKIPYLKVSNLTKFATVKLDLSKACSLILPFSGSMFYKFYVRECAAGRGDRVICVSNDATVKVYDFLKPMEKSLIMANEIESNHQR